jgi:hypothetical protein
MASGYVRSTVKGWLQAMPMPFVDTVSIEAAPIYDAWVSVDWTFAGRERLTFCEEYAELGTFNLVCFFRPGVGDDSAVLQAEAVTLALMGNVDPTGNLELMSYGTPEDFLEDAWYVLSTSVNYRAKG